MASIEALKAYMRKILSSQYLSDVKIYSLDGTKIRGHKVVLAAASPFLRETMGVSSKVYVDVKGAILVKMIKFIYTGEVKIKKVRK